MEIEECETNILTEAEYEKIKLLNQKAFSLIQEFITMLNELLEKTCNETGLIINICKIYCYKSAIDLQSRNCLKKINIVLELGKQKYIDQEEGRSITRYYYNDAYNFIRKPVTQQILILKIYTKKIVKLIREPKTRKEFQKSRAKIRRKLDKLQKEQKNIGND